MRVRRGTNGKTVSPVAGVSRKTTCRHGALEGPPEGPLVEAEWLRAHRNEVIVLDASVGRMARPGGATDFVSGQDAFRREHVPGARLADLFGGFSDPLAPFAFTCPRIAKLEAEARRIGIRKDSRVVVYDRLGGAYAARVWLLFRQCGFDRVHVLNGGLAAWVGAGGVLENGPEPAVPAGDFIATPTPSLFVSTGEVERLVASGDPRHSPLICGLRRTQFSAGDSDDPRLGHIPGSLNLPYAELLDDQGRLDAVRLENALAALGFGSDFGRQTTPVLYCGGGINAAGLALAMTAAGRPSFRIYDDSMNGWTADPGRPVRRGPES